MTCSVCGRPAPAGSCEEGYVRYLSGDYPCPFNPDKDWLEVKNPRELPNVSGKRVQISDKSEHGLEDLL